MKSPESIASNFWLSINAHAKPVDIVFPQENSRTVGVVTDDEEHTTARCNIPHVSMYIQKDPGCSVSTSFLAVIN